MRMEVADDNPVHTRRCHRRCWCQRHLGYTDLRTKHAAIGTTTAPRFVRDALGKDEIGLADSRPDLAALQKGLRVPDGGFAVPYTHDPLSILGGLRFLDGYNQVMGTSG